MTTSNENNQMRAPRSISELLAPFEPQGLQEEMERFRVDWEQTHGPTDLRRLYVSMMPPEYQQRVIDADMECWLDGLAPYMRAYIIQRVTHHVRDGRLDELPDEVVRWYSRRKSSQSD